MLSAGRLRSSGCHLGLLGSLDRSTDRRPGHAEQLGNVAGRVGAGAVKLHEVLLLRGGEFRLAATEPAGGLGDRHALPGAGPNEVSFELGHHAEDIEQEPADGIGGVVDRSPKMQ